MTSSTIDSVRPRCWMSPRPKLAGSGELVQHTTQLSRASKPVDSFTRQQPPAADAETKKPAASQDQDMMDSKGIGGKGLRQELQAFFQRFQLSRPDAAQTHLNAEVSGDSFTLTKPSGSESPKQALMEYQGRATLQAEQNRFRQTDGNQPPQSAESSALLAGIPAMAGVGLLAAPVLAPVPLAVSPTVVNPALQTLGVAAAALI